MNRKTNHIDLAVCPSVFAPPGKKFRVTLVPRIVRARVPVLWSFLHGIPTKTTATADTVGIIGFRPTEGTKLQGLTSGVNVSASAWTRVFSSFWFLAILVLVSAILTSLVFSSTKAVSTLPENPNLMFGIIDMCNAPASLSGVDPKLTGTGTGCTTTEPAVSASIN